MAYNFTDLKNKIKQTEEWLKKEFSSIRTGRATPNLLDSVLVEAYGSKMAINQVAAVTTEDARTVRVSPYDIGQTKAIEKAIGMANLGVSAVGDEKGVRVMFPELTAERREALIKVAKQKLEDARVSLRKERDHVWNDIQKKEKDGGVTEDEKFRLKNDMQKMIDETNKKLDESLAKKEKEITS
jgi:ribosome recycling factor